MLSKAERNKQLCSLHQGPGFSHLCLCIPPGRKGSHIFTCAFPPTGFLRLFPSIIKNQNMKAHGSMPAKEQQRGKGNGSMPAREQRRGRNQWRKCQWGNARANATMSVALLGQRGDGCNEVGPRKRGANWRAKTQADMAAICAINGQMGKGRGDLTAMKRFWK